MSGNFLAKGSWKNIDRGYIFDAAIYYPSDTKRPLDFFIPDPTKSGYGRISSDIGDFRPQKVDGVWKAVEQQVVVSLKPRKVVVLSNNEINHNEDFEFIVVAPIMTINDLDKKKSWYTKMLSDDHPFFLHLDASITRRECYVDLSELISIHKGMLLNKHNLIPDERFLILNELLTECLALGLADEGIDEDTGTTL